MAERVLAVLLEIVRLDIGALPQRACIEILGKQNRFSILAVAAGFGIVNRFDRIDPKTLLASGCTGEKTRQCNCCKKQRETIPAHLFGKRRSCSRTLAG